MGGASAVQGIARQRIAQRCHMDPDLVGASGLQRQFHEGVRPVLPQGTVVSHGGFAVLPDTAPDHRAVSSADGGGDGAGFLQCAAHQCEVGLFHPALQKRRTVGGFRRQTDAAGVPVQPVDRTKGQLRMRRCKDVPQRVRAVPMGGVHWHAVGLVVENPRRRFL